MKKKYSLAHRCSIASAFIWCNTNEGCDFWCNVNEKYEEYYEKHTRK